MANFYAYDFMYDDIPSQRFDLKIITFEDGGLFNGVGSSDINILTQRVLRKSTPYYLGRTQEPVLEFPLTFGTAAPISGMDRDIISAWLFGRSVYKKLYILQDDLNGAYFNCFLTKPEPLYVGNLNYAFQCTVVCDSPFAYAPEKFISGSIVTSGSYNLYNSSSEDEYLYPTVSFRIVDGEIEYLYGVEVGFTFSITNVTDSNRIFSFEGLAIGDEIYVNNDLQIVSGLNTSSEPPVTLTGLLNKFIDKKWLRLLPKNNVILIEGPTVSFQLTWSEKLKIGG
jgi:hypothetical protein